MAKVHPIKIIFVASAVWVATFQWLSHMYHPLWLLGPIIPGEMLGLLVTGGHGGTHFEDRVATFLSFAANTGLYTLLSVTVTSMVRMFRRK